MNSSKTPLWPLALFTAVYVGLAAWASWRFENSEFVFYLVVMVILIIAVIKVHSRVTLTLGTLWALSAWGALHMAGGLVPVPESWPHEGSTRVLYSLWLIPDRLKYDQVIHAYGFGVTCWVCWQGYQASFSSRKEDRGLEPTFGQMVLVASMGMGFGALNEVVEFAATLLVPETNVGGYRNTGWDLVSNLVGCLIAVSLIFASGRSKRMVG